MILMNISFMGHFQVNKNFAGQVYYHAHSYDCNVIVRLFRNAVADLFVGHIYLFSTPEFVGWFLSHKSKRNLMSTKIVVD